MKILHVITRLIVGGAQELVLLLCADQIQAGHDVTLAYGRTAGPEGSLIDAAQRLAGLHLQEIPDMAPDPDPPLDDIASRQLLQLILRERYDVVHTHTFKGGVLGRQAAQASQTRCIVHTVHGSRFFEEQPERQNAVIVEAERQAARQCHRILCVSEALKKRYLDAEIGNPEQYRVVYSGLNLTRYAQIAAVREEARAALGFLPQDIVIGTVARVTRLKGHHEILSAMAADLRQDPRLKLLWVGDGDARTELEAEARLHRVGHQVLWTGMQSPDRVPWYTAAMDVMAHPSRREGFPLAIIHAMLCGVPAVAYDVDGPRELGLDGEAGLLVEKGNVDGLQEAIRRLVADPEIRRSMGSLARRMATDRYDHRRMTAEVERHYQEVIDASFHRLPE